MGRARDTNPFEPQRALDKTMEWLNYNHLFYFWRIAREGGLSRAAERLGVTHSTLSAQLGQLEDALGGSLFERRGRVLVLTPFGEEAAAYADDIFRLGGELLELARGRSLERRTALRVGVIGSIPKSLAYDLLEPGIRTPGHSLLVARQDNYPRLLEELAGGRLHMVLSDMPPPEATSQRVYAHLLGESGILIYGTPELAKRYRRGFPRSLEGAPLLVPAAATSLRLQLERWFTERWLHLQVEGEFDDAGLMRIAGARGRGLFPVREALRAEVEESLDVKMIGRFDGIVERYYVVTGERRVRHPAVSRLIETAREGLRHKNQTTARARPESR